MLGWLRNRFATNVAPQLEKPAGVIIVHLIVTVALVASISIVDLALSVFGLSTKEIPHTGVALSDLMLYLEVIAATLIILVGIFKAVIALMIDLSLVFGIGVILCVIIIIVSIVALRLRFAP